MENEDKIEWLTGICSTVYGDHWKPALAAHLGVNDRSVRQWANGERTIPDSVVRGLLSLAHDRANALLRRAERAAFDMRGQPGYERIIFQPALRLDEVRRDLYTEKRAWFDIDGQLFALNENGSVIDIRGYETTWAGVSILPDGVTVNDLLQAEEKYINENGNY
ncbi:helix-turn-helix domain-containing protein [Raoultella terrigena]|jgi:hypothetical protein|uniref:hypothetical protein n=1 Tax=Raoultella terrigena TaxID=577 RepID=UPI00349F8F50